MICTALTVYLTRTIVLQRRTQKLWLRLRRSFRAGVSEQLETPPPVLDFNDYVDGTSRNLMHWQCKAYLEVIHW